MHGCVIFEHIRARAADQQIVATIADQQIAAFAARKHVAQVAAVQRVVALMRLQEGFAIARDQQIIAQTAQQQIVIVVRNQHIAVNRAVGDRVFVAYVLARDNRLVLKVIGDKIVIQHGGHIRIANRHHPFFTRLPIGVLVHIGAETFGIIVIGAMRAHIHEGPAIGAG